MSGLVALHFGGVGFSISLAALGLTLDDLVVLIGCFWTWLQLDLVAVGLGSILCGECLVQPSYGCHHQVLGIRLVASGWWH